MIEIRELKSYIYTQTHTSISQKSKGQSNPSAHW